jgi:ABC-type lipoprotein release transport system permease subunit
MKTVRKLSSLMLYAIGKFRDLGARTLLGCASALIAAILVFAAPEVGIAGACSGLAFGVVSAVLIHPRSA